MMLPAAAGWGAVGWRSAREAIRRTRGVRAWRVAAFLAAAVAIQSPWVMAGKFDVESEHLIIGRRLDELCPRQGMVVVMGQMLGWPALHYSHRLGWVEQCQTLPADWRERLQGYRRLGAEVAALYFDASVPDRARKSYDPMLATLPVLENGGGPWFRRRLPWRVLHPRPPRPGRPGRRRDPIAAVGARCRVARCAGVAMRSRASRIPCRGPETGRKLEGSEESAGYINDGSAMGSRPLNVEMVDDRMADVLRARAPPSGWRSPTGCGAPPAG